VANGECDVRGNCSGGGLIRTGVEWQRCGDTAADYDVRVDCDRPWWKRDTVGYRHGDASTTERILLGQLDQHHSGNSDHPGMADL
jgi:hypothetical protein